MIRSKLFDNESQLNEFLNSYVKRSVVSIQRITKEVLSDVDLPGVPAYSHSRDFIELWYNSSEQEIGTKTDTEVLEDLFYNKLNTTPQSLAECFSRDSEVFNGNLELKTSPIPIEAHSLEVFAIKDSESSPTGKEAYIGYKLANEDFHFIQAPYTENIKS